MDGDQKVSKDLINVEQFVSGISDPALREASRMLALGYRKFQESEKRDLTFREAEMVCDMTAQLSKNAIADLGFRNMLKGRYKEDGLGINERYIKIASNKHK